MMSSKENKLNKTPLQLKGSLFTLTVLQIYTDNIKHIDEQLNNSATRNPNFFQHMPVVIDMQHLHADIKEFDFLSLKNSLFEHNIIPVGVRCECANLKKQAIDCGFAIMPIAQVKPLQDYGQTETTSKNDVMVQKPQLSNNVSKVVTHPVRSGQQVYAKDGDLIVLASVSHGAELLADGHIHVYGALRGRALAGINGNENAHIFCQQLDAELLAVAGHYMVKDDIQKVIMENSNTNHIYFSDGKLQIGTI